jgi:general L-amino acid transport system ATP-binding protein
VEVLDGIDLDVRRGEKVVICGPSGSGKSTLIRCVNQIERHQSGKIYIDGREMTGKASDIHRQRQKIGMVFQSFNLFPHMTALRNCTLALTWVKKIPVAKANEIALAMLKSVNIESHAHSFPAQLSGGQQQRVAIARALCMEPSMMLFDEPTSALDPESIQEVLTTIINVCTSGMTVICVTHEMNFAKKIADRIIFMDQGRIVEQGTPSEFFDRPKTDRARKFLSQIL